ncbi:MAG: ABC transporter ATP-binding protein [Planctomycetes bacterium]|nr:ABC transporter ATP-binding protein [Planctomycetota bacterium]
MPIISIKNMTKTFQIGDVRLDALKNLDLTINKGEYITIMGPSGSGKSTMLNLLGCLDTPTKGQYFLDGQDIATLEDDLLSKIRGKKTGFIFQSYNLIAQLNIIENIEVPMYYQGMSETLSKERAEELAEIVGLSDRLKHKPSELSGGQQQRVAIARALANDPVVLLADEPTGNLDSKSGYEILEILNDLHEKGKTLIVITHDDRIAKLSERTIHLLDGRIDKEDNNKR